MDSRDKSESSALTGYLDDIWSQPDEFDGAFDQTATALAEALTPARCAGTVEVVLTGCGDSHYAGVAAAMAFEQFAGVRTRALTSMQLSRYETILPLTGTLVIAVSVSGETTRTVEGATLAKAAGALTVGVSSKPTSRLALATDVFVASTVPPARVHGPDARTYMSSLLVLLAAAVQLGESLGYLEATAAAQVRARLRASSDVMRRTLESCDAAARAAANALVVEPFSAIMAVGAGPAYGVAQFAAAKVIEASGDHAWAQDGEEWAHIEYWLADSAMPTILIATPGRSYDRLGEQLDAMNRIGRRAIVIAPVGDPLLSQSSFPLPIVVGDDEAFVQLSAALAVELLSYYLVAAKGLLAYAVTRDDHGGGPSNALRAELTADKLDALRAQVGGRP